MARTTKSKRDPQREAAARQAVVPVQGRSSALSGRLSADREELIFGNLLVLEPPPTYEESWRTRRLDSKTLSRIGATELAEVLADLSPEVSKALWDYLRQSNAGWEIKAFRPGTETEDANAKVFVDAFVALLGEYYGSFDVVINRLYMGGFMRGAFFAELVISSTGKLPIDFATPDPAIVRFRKVQDPERGIVYEMGQMQRGKWVAFDRPTMSYIPIDPMPGKPYGRPMVSPALFTTLFLIGLLHDLRRVISQQGYPRPDIEIDLAQLREAMPDTLEDDPEAKQAWVQSIVDAVVNAYASLEPEDAYVHTSVVKMNRPMGTVDAGSMGEIWRIIEALERMAVRALKSAPFMMSVADGTTETQANRQWEAHLQGIKSLQHLVEAMLERLLGLALRVQGVAADVQVRFAENRASEMMRDAQTETIQIANAREKYRAGFIDQDDASEEITGHTASEPEPRLESTNLAPPVDAEAVAAAAEAAATPLTEPVPPTAPIDGEPAQETP